jgi:ribosomal-protein-alanine N-acetyltransferase
VARKTGARAGAGAVQTGARVFLRRPTARDRDAYLGLRRRSAAFLRSWEPAPSRGTTETKRFSAWLQSGRGERHEKLLVCRRVDGAIMGAVNVNEIVRGPAQSAFLGYWIGAPYARQGYMTEALRLALHHAYTTLGLHRVEANIMPINRASIALVKRAGFRREGYSARYLKIAGRWSDHERWALTIEDWRARERAQSQRNF